MSTNARALDVPSRVSGTETLAIGSDTGTMARTLPDVPVRVWVSVQAPAGGDVIFANVVGDPTDDGFDFQLSAAPTVDGYKLCYVCDF
jgi:hypothetical protein